MSFYDTDQVNIVLHFEVGISDQGKSIVKRMTLSNVRHDLTADEVAQVSLALASLVKHDLMVVERVVYETVGF
ncbi:MAG TPA: DUF1659 domain-containing protein [Ureibacillus sp.]|nr:DUF1659 domain-containing protein [Ureibacillus sp.]